MSYGDYRQSSGDHVPLVGRPRGAAWRTLQADGVVWEGQVVLVGGEIDLATRMIVTHRRVTFARGGAIVLDLAREWLRPAPILRRDGTIQLSITPPGASFDVEPETIALRMRDGHPAAGHVIAMLAGSGARRITPEAVPSSEYVRGVLPPLPDSRRSNPFAKSDDEPSSPEFPLLTTRLDDDLPFGSFEFQPPRSRAPQLPASAPAPSQPPPDRDLVVRQTAPPMSMARDRSWNLEPQVRQMLPRGTRRRRGWIFRLGGLVLLLGFSAMLGADRIPFPSLSPIEPGAPGVVSTATVRPVAQYIQPTAAAGVASTALAESTTFVLGIGSEGQPAPTPSGAAAPAAQATAEPTAATEQPATTEPATVGATVEAPAAAATSTPEPAVTEAPAAAATAAPATSESAGPLGLTVDRASRGATLPEYGLAAPNEGEWVVVMLAVTNESDAEIELAMSDFGLDADGAAIAVDTRSTVVASILRLQGAPDEISSPVRLDPGESVTLPLVFPVPADASALTLHHGETGLDLTPDLAVTATSGIVRSRGFTARQPSAIALAVLDWE